MTDRLGFRKATADACEAGKPTSPYLAPLSSGFLGCLVCVLSRRIPRVAGEPEHQLSPRIDQ